MNQSVEATDDYTLEWDSRGFEHEHTHLGSVDDDLAFTGFNTEAGGESVAASTTWTTRKQSTESPYKVRFAAGSPPDKPHHGVRLDKGSFQFLPPITASSYVDADCHNGRILLHHDPSVKTAYEDTCVIDRVYNKDGRLLFETHGDLNGSSNGRQTFYCSNPDCSSQGLLVQARRKKAAQIELFACSSWCKRQLEEAKKGRQLVMACFFDESNSLPHVVKSTSMDSERIFCISHTVAGRAQRGAVDPTHQLADDISLDHTYPVVASDQSYDGGFLAGTAS